MSDEEMLQHYGILGMKWGVRRTPAQLTRANGRAGKTESSDEIKKMSDSELRSKINRLQMEKQYKQLTSSEISVGRKFVQDVLTNAAKQTATNYVSKYMTKAIRGGLWILITGMIVEILHLQNLIWSLCRTNHFTMHR